MLGRFVDNLKRIAKERSGRGSFKGISQLRLQGLRIITKKKSARISDLRAETSK
jgi:hypothetical protein